MDQGILYLVATPIGNLEDITLRALRVLREVDLIACEDTRHTSKLLGRYDIPTPRESYHEHNELSRLPRLLELLTAGKSIALVSDAGVPLISDPGYPLVSQCRKQNIAVVVVPGPSAVTAAISASGLPVDSFYFAGFLPARSASRRRKLQEMKAVPSALVLFEAPHRVLSSLEDMASVLGDRRICVGRELTKIHEEWLQGSVLEVLRLLRSRPRIKGEITLIVDRPGVIPQAASWPASIGMHVDEETRKTGASRKEALRSVAMQRGITRKEAYRLLLAEKDQ